VTLEMGEEIEFPKLVNAGELIEPYVDLWRMVRNFDNYNQVWSKTPVFKLDAELIEKEVKQMNSKSIKLNNRFNTSSSVSRNDKSKKSPTLEGPLKMLDSLTNQIKDYFKLVPLIRVFSNPGMKERHWTQISEYTHFPVNPDQNLNIRKLADIEEIFDKIPEMELVSENAEKEFGI
jgi:dynein heavy chain